MAVRLRRSVVGAGLAVVIAVALVACTDDGSPDGGDDDGVALETGTPLYLVDGNLGAASIQDLPAGTMTGVIGTLPGAEVTDDFLSRIGEPPTSSTELSSSPSPSGSASATGSTAYSYAPETYDAVVLTALAVQAAGSDRSSDVAQALPEVSAGGDECSTYTECNDLLRQGTDINYQGQSGAVDLDDHGGLASGTVGVFSYDDQNLVPGYTAPSSSDHSVDYVDGDVTAPKRPAPQVADVAGPSPNGQLVLGGLIPASGDLAGFTPPLEAAMKAAVSEINDAGGVLGRTVVLNTEDVGTDTDPGSVVNGLITGGADVIVSAASSSTTLDVLDEVVGAGALMVSSAATASRLATASDSGLFFRLAPSDELQADVLAGRVVDNGAQKVAIIARKDVYGRGLAASLSRDLDAKNAEVVATEMYRPNQHSFTSQVQAVASAAPDAIVLVGFEESSKVIEELVAQGIGPQSS
jgi:ABC-type branched-subunit amino acid transport system substrate-binding protein